MKACQAMIGIVFAAMHQPWTAMYFCMYELACKTDDAISLREELLRCCSKDDSWKELDSCLLLDSFLKECFRRRPGDKSMLSG